VNDSLHPSAPHDLPGFITAPGDTDTSSCIVNAYTSNHDLIASKETGTLKGLALHAVDAIGIGMRCFCASRPYCCPSKRWC